MGKINFREYEINFNTCNKGCSTVKDTTHKFVVFNMPSKLRSHTVKHMIAKRNEDRIKVYDITEDHINECRKKLKDINCPYYILDCDIPPCFAHQKGCPVNLCRNIEDINKLETRYVNIILEGLTDCGKLPRYACYHEVNNESKTWMLSAVSDRGLIIHSGWMSEHRKYNLRSCYQKPQWKTFKEFLNKAREKMENNKGVEFCSRENWDYVKP